MANKSQEASDFYKKHMNTGKPGHGRLRGLIKVNPPVTRDEAEKAGHLPRGTVNIGWICDCGVVLLF